MKTLELAEIKKKIAQHFKKVNKKYGCYDPYEIDYLADNFGYLGPEVCERYVEDVTIDGEEYEKRACWVGEENWAFHGAPCFLCYSLYRIADIPNHLVSEYAASKKLYSLDIDKDDFPSNFFPDE